MAQIDNPTPPDGYEDVSVPIMDILQSAQIIALILMVAPIILHSIVHSFKQFIDTASTTQTLLLAIPVAISFIIAHEAIHALGWVIFGRFSPLHIKFGIDRKTFSPYAHTTVSMNITAYRIGAVLPSIITGILPAIYGIIEAEGAITLLGAFMTSAAVGDFYVLWVIRKIPANATVLDHPTQAGCYVKVS